MISWLFKKKNKSNTKDFIEDIEQRRKDLLPFCADYGFYKTFEEVVNAQVGKIGIIKEVEGGYIVIPPPWASEPFSEKNYLREKL